MTEKLFTGMLSKKQNETKTMLVLLRCGSNVPVHENKGFYTVGKQRFRRICASEALLFTHMKNIRRKDMVHI